ncbi:hypothetical protein ACTL6U_17280 [Rhodovibrionaceae bacterium A322]
MKRVLIAAMVAVLIAAGGIYWLVSNLDSIVKAQIEEVGSEVTGTALTLDSVEINLGKGQASLVGLELANPSGFSQDQALVFDEVSVTLDLKSLKQDVVVVKEISIIAPEILYEITQSGSNLEAIEKHASQTAGGDGQSGSGQSGSSDQQKDDHKMIIENFYLKSAALRMKIPGASKELEAAIPDLHLTNIGKEENGANPNQVASQLINQLFPHIMASATKLDMKALLGKAGLDPALANNLQGLNGGSGSLSDTVKDAGNAIKNLLGD